MPGGLRSPSPTNSSIAIYTGILANATFELFVVEPPANAAPTAATATATATGGVRIKRYLSRDLRSYQAPVELVLPGLPGNAQVRAASVAKDNVTGSYMLLAFAENGATNITMATAFTSTDGLAWAPAGGGYAVDPGCSQTGLLHHPAIGWLSYQRTLQPLKIPKRYPDRVGADRRRVVTIVVSKDHGKTWVPADNGVLQPDAVSDPPEMELGVGVAGFVPFWCNDLRLNLRHCFGCLAL